MTRVALLIDGENIASRYFAEIARYCLSLGELSLMQVFADFSDGKSQGWLTVCREYGLQPMLQLSGGKGKNSTDIAIVVAAMDVMHDKIADIVCLASSDRDFIPLAQRLRVGGIRVVGIGRAAADKALAECCDEFFLLEEKSASARPNLLAIDAVATSTNSKVKSPAKPHPMLSPDEQAMISDLIAELCCAAGTRSVRLAVIGNELQKRQPTLAKRLGKGRLLKQLRLAAFVVRGLGTSIVVEPRRAA